MAMQVQSEGGERGVKGRKHPAVAQPLGKELKLDVAEVLSDLVTQLLGRVYSPRIKLLSVDQVCEVTGLGRSTIHKMIKRGDFPKPQRNIGKGRWRECALIAWLDANDPNQD